MKVNGRDVSLGAAISLEEFIDTNGYRKERIAVELNGRIVLKAEYETTVLEENDSIEIVTFVGGG